MAGHAEVHRATMQRALTDAAAQWGDRVGQAVVNAARAACPADEGRLRSSVTHTADVRGNRAVVRVGSPLEYARYVHEGTGIYGPRKSPIVPVTAKALKFRAPRQMGPLPVGAKNLPRNKRPFVFAKSVKGSPPSPFLTAGLTAVFGDALVRENPTQ